MVILVMSAVLFFLNLFYSPPLSPLTPHGLKFSNENMRVVTCGSKSELARKAGREEGEKDREI